MIGNRRKQVLTEILGPKPGENKDASPAPDSLQAVAEELIEAVQSKDSAGVAAALKAAFELMDSEPHVEGPHIAED